MQDNNEMINEEIQQVNSDQTMSATIGELVAAVSIMQSDLEGAKKDSTNPFFKSNYADLTSVWAVIRPHLKKNRLAVFQTTNDDGEFVNVITTLAHDSGEWIRGSLKMKPVKNDPQGIGSALTYARRYALAAMCGVSQEDDDANSASGKTSTVNVKLSESEIKEIEKGLTETGSDVTKFCQAFKVNSIEDLPQSHLDSARSAIAKKKAQVKKAEKKDEDNDEVS